MDTAVIDCVGGLQPALLWFSAVLLLRCRCCCVQYYFYAAKLVVSTKQCSDYYKMDTAIDGGSGVVPCHC